MTRSDSYARVAYADPDTSRAWFQLLAGHIGLHESDEDTPSEIGLPNLPTPGDTTDTTVARNQYVATGGPARASRAWLNRVWRAVRPFASGQAYQNYIDPQLTTWQRAYYASNLGRLRQVKKTYDPDFKFRFKQAIPPAG